MVRDFLKVLFSFTRTAQVVNLRMFRPACSALLLASLCGLLQYGYGLDGMQAIGAGMAANQALNGGGPAGKVIEGVPKCNVPVDTSM